MTHTSSDLKNWSQQLHNTLTFHRHRACLVLSGEFSWQQQMLNTLIQTGTKGIFIGTHSLHSQAEATHPKQLKLLLGQETDFAIFRAEEGIEADALGIVSGMIRAGGLCIICLPDQTTFEDLPNPLLKHVLNFPLTPNDSLQGFNRYLWQALQQTALWCTPHEPLPDLSTLKPAKEVSAWQGNRTPDQIDALEAIHHVAYGHRKRPLVLTADRGRGKSTALGLACIELIRSGKKRITLTAARLTQVQMAFKAIEEQTDALTYNGFECVEKRPGLVVFQHNDQLYRIEFKAPDDLIASDYTSDILMVDESAHLPLPMLKQLLKLYSRTVLATTQQGYEGSGRGFQLKLSHYLSQHYPGWKHLKLNTPIRWHAQDPLEKGINQLLLLENDPPTIETLHASSSGGCQIQRCSVLSLLQSAEGKARLKQIFQLLTQAHYQTRPNDLMQILEVPNQQLWVAQADNKVIGVLLAVEEGELPTDLAENRRLQGHLCPQLLTKNTADRSWLALKTLRIQRVAVQLDTQQQGIGTQLVSDFLQANQTDYDCVTTSYGATPELIQFWRKNHFKPLHLGLKRDKASGMHSLVMCQPFSATAKALTKSTLSTFQTQFAWNLTDSFKDLEPALAIAILQGGNFPNTTFPKGYLQQQPYESVAFALRDWTLAHIDQIKVTPLMESWVEKVLQTHPWQQVCLKEKLNRKALEIEFKAWLKSVLQAH
ncbi:GNAT family N-acetyltransferase [Hydrogenovibrio sp. 3SP14C1]|uniref:GNAT family N-acetyltransferase n=1 Tax=Hydrogenovibrio sp. 3SP14C1 TaxID=3038774 RepID=UPI002415AF98|nr:GNAT family N-acetyltransferase [Hydrogenovibrio sp. 3SP14C1]MDG4811483.1 GNAT family N-acetyltransferase [Hydrogenovibrio sp. 3SP14C1]